MKPALRMPNGSWLESADGSCPDDVKVPGATRIWLCSVCIEERPRADILGSTGLYDYLEERTRNTQVAHHVRAAGRCSNQELSTAIRYCSEYYGLKLTGDKGEEMLRAAAAYKTAPSCEAVVLYCRRMMNELGEEHTIDARRFRKLLAFRTNRALAEISKRRQT